MNVLGLDPGTSQSALVIFNGLLVLEHGIYPNEVVLDRLRIPSHTGVLVIEQVESFGDANSRNRTSKLPSRISVAPKPNSPATTSSPTPPRKPKAKPKPRSPSDATTYHAAAPLE